MCPTAGPSHTEIHILYSYASPIPQYALTNPGPGQQHPIQPPLWPLHPMCASALDIHSRNPGNVFVRLESEERRGSKKRWRDSETRWARTSQLSCLFLQDLFAYICGFTTPLPQLLCKLPSNFY